MVNGIKIKVELAITPQAQIKGLGNRLSMPSDHGLFFEYRDYKIRSFWMKDMLFPIDIVWLKDNQIIGIEKNVSVSEPNAELKHYTSPEPINGVLELQAGFTDHYNIKTGDSIIKKY
jgi:hypothetical protein